MKTKLRPPPTPPPAITVASPKVAFRPKPTSKTVPKIPPPKPQPKKVAKTLEDLKNGLQWEPDPVEIANLFKEKDDPDCCEYFEHTVVLFIRVEFYRESNFGFKKLFYLHSFDNSPGSWFKWVPFLSRFSIIFCPCINFDCSIFLLLNKIQITLQTGCRIRCQEMEDVH